MQEGNAAGDRDDKDAGEQIAADVAAREDGAQIAEIPGEGQQRAAERGIGEEDRYRCA